MRCPRGVTLNPSGWKVYTLWDPPDAEPGARGGWFLDDEATGYPVPRPGPRPLGPRIVCAHKGIAGPVPDKQRRPAPHRAHRARPPAPLMWTFVVYHSGYDVDTTSEEGCVPRGVRGSEQRGERFGVVVQSDELLALSRMIADDRARPGVRPAPDRYGVVVLSVKVSALLYAPVRSASAALTSWLNSSDTASLEIGPL